MDLLAEIIAKKRSRVETAKASTSLGRMRKFAEEKRANAEPHRLLKALSIESRTNIIAEFKKRSPSRGEINSAADPAALARIYQAAGAAAISVLTEEEHFAGSLADLRAVRDATSLAILRKDFIFEEFQVYESAASEADALLLIVAALDDATLQRLRKLAEELKLDALIEVHTEEELDRAVRAGAHLIGVNNRDLRTFKVSTSTSEKLIRLSSADAVLVSESGLNPVEVRRLRALGYKGFLVGETLMRATDPAAALREFVDSSSNEKGVQVKICGITNLEDARGALAAGADMLGFNFYRHSPRFIDPESAGRIIESLKKDSTRTAKMVGVFVDEATPESVAEITKQSGIEAVQLHGNESVEFCSRLRSLLPGFFLIKVVHLLSNGPSRVADYDVDAIMLDAFDPDLRGGTGRTIDWQAARETRESVPRLILAGGLSPQNVAAAIAAVQPYAVDACSALESSPGKKNAARVKTFVQAARSA